MSDVCHDAHVHKWIFGSVLCKLWSRLHIDSYLAIVCMNTFVHTLKIYVPAFIKPEWLIIQHYLSSKLCDSDKCLMFFCLSPNFYNEHQLFRNY